MDVSVKRNASSWLTTRAGLSHNIYDRTGDASTADNTTGRIGMGIHAPARLTWTPLWPRLLSSAPEEEVGGLNSQVTDISNGFFSQLSVEVPLVI